MSYFLVYKKWLKSTYALWSHTLHCWLSRLAGSLGRSHTASEKNSHARVLPSAPSCNLDLCRSSFVYSVLLFCIGQRPKGNGILSMVVSQQMVRKDGKLSGRRANFRPFLLIYLWWGLSASAKEARTKTFLPLREQLLCNLKLKFALERS